MAEFEFFALSLLKLALALLGLSDLFPIFLQRAAVALSIVFTFGAGDREEVNNRGFSIISRAIGRALQPRSSNTVRWLCGIGCEIALGQIGNGDRQRPWCSLAFANVPQRLLPKNSPKQLK